VFTESYKYYLIPLCVICLNIVIFLEDKSCSSLSIVKCTNISIAMIYFFFSFLFFSSYPPSLSSFLPSFLPSFALLNGMFTKNYDVKTYIEEMYMIIV